MSKISSQWFQSVAEAKAKTGVEFKAGKYSDQESQLIKDELEQFREARNISVEQLRECFVDTKQMKAILGRNAWTEMSQNLSAKLNRPVRSIHRRAKRMYYPTDPVHGVKRGKWEQEEYRILLAQVRQHGRCWTEISKRMGRSPEHVRDCWKRLCAVEKRSWTEEELQTLERLAKRYYTGPKLTADEWAKDTPTKLISWLAVASGFNPARGEGEVCTEWQRVVQKRREVLHMASLKGKNFEKAGATLMEEVLQPDRSQVVRGKVQLTVKRKKELGLNVAQIRELRLTKDLKLLQELWEMGVEHESEVTWSALRGPLNGQVARQHWLNLAKPYQHELATTAGKKGFEGVLEKLIKVSI
jgi:hypothetical protein